MATRRDKAEAGRQFFRRVASDGAFAPVFLLYGAERFLVDEGIRRLTSAVFPDGRDDFNFAAFHGSECSGGEVAGAASQAPMFASRRLVVLKGADQMKVSELEALSIYAEDPADFSVLVIEAVKLDGRQKAVKRLLAASHAIEFGTLYDRDAANWVERQARRRGLSIGRDGASYLVDALGTALGPLDMALERVQIYVGDAGSATVEDVRSVVPDTRVRSVFELTDHLSARGFAQAAACFHRMLEQGESPIGSLAMIARQFRQLLLAKDGAARGLRDRELAKHIGCPPFRVGAISTAARGFTEARLRGILRSVAETDLALKSSRLPRETLVERLFVRICSA
jgi:DNA polymerase-3 subunit delta